MSSYADMSLDDIIKKKREEARAKRRKVKALPFKPLHKMAPIMDARYKIRSKNRTEITDAREILTQLTKQKDARLKLDQLRQERARVPERPLRHTFPNRGIFARAPPVKEIVFADSSRQVVSQTFTPFPIGLKRQMSSQTFTEARSTQQSRLLEFQHKQKPKPLLQTVGNDSEVIDDLMEEEYVPQTLAALNRKPSLQLKIITHNNDGCDNNVATIHRTVVAEEKNSPPRLPSIQNKLPTTTLRSDVIAQKTEKPRLEYRIIVSNLSNSVTGADIQELFGDVGNMLESRLVRPGTAEVIYLTQEDAQIAVDLYHNRHLDGQPMNCLLVTPRPPMTARSSQKPELCSTSSTVEPDISTFHEVLFRKL